MSQPAPEPLGGPPREAGGAPADPGAPVSVDDLQRQIRTTRAQLSETVAALSAKTHVATRAQNKAGELVGRVRDSEMVGRARRGEFGELVRHAPVVERAREVDVRQLARRGVEGARRRPLPLAAGLSAMLAALVLAIRRRRTAGRLADRRSAERKSERRKNTARWMAGRRTIGRRMAAWQVAGLCGRSWRRHGRR
ncbi:MAG TPA: DUF3618 domain-containing protein [Kineosporiaceae bacterium]|nr:DUF3618 domain-containing protein [Kineosporiaceae bacterium]